MIVYDKKGYILHEGNKVLHKGSTWTIVGFKGRIVKLKRFHQSDEVECDMIEKTF